MPVVFIGHGSPMNAIEDNRWHQGWQALGQTFGEKARYPRPQLILCVSAHWLTRGWHLTGMRQPRTIHDFGGFPRALFEVQYPAPGAPAVAQHWAAQLRQPHNDQAVVVDEHQWGLDHGSWSVLLPMFPKADIPVMQLSMDYSRPLAEHWALGEQLRVLRDRGVLIVGSGNIVHNLRAMATTRSDEQEAHDWALEFDAQTTHRLNQRDHAALTQVLQAPQRSLTQLAHPSHEHYLPLLYAAGASHPGEVPRYFNEGHQMAAISMRSAVWG
jgi:4,5-DOPA dioxygenase extradiol